VFIDLGGVVGLAHISELSWRRVEHPSAFLRPGDEVKVRVINVDEERQRVGLSIRSLTPDPLESIKVGEVLHGVITRLVDFGAFVLVDNLFEGLVHISNLAEQRISVPEEVVSPGQEVQVKVLAIDVERRRMDLSLKDA
jgi:small subunit ribosomal protein S1